MEQEQVETFRQKLLALKDELEQLNHDSKESSETVALDQSKVGRLSRMDALQAQQMAQETARRRQIQSHKIESALRRIDAGDYGYCLACGDEIGTARLGFDPASTRCMGCMDG
ncbi:MAG: TraR/DksA family transcriptional regulator [Halioglobus sp.]|nr:TraR/DksA family transcriptional regulator [Halioglobus sp.]